MYINLAHFSPTFTLMVPLGDNEQRGIVIE